jgi:6-phosphogluconolactonase
MTHQQGLTAGERLYVGTHRRAHRADQADIAHGIYHFEREAAESAFEARGICETAQPGWLATHPDGRTLYAVNEVRELGDHPGGAVTAFAIDPETGVLRALNRALLPPMPCHCTVDPQGRYLLVATFGGGSVHLFELLADGSLRAERDRHVHTGSSAHPQRQTAPHAHAVAIAPGGRFVLVPDLGTDQVWVYEVDATAFRLVPRLDLRIEQPPLSGPRHLAFSPDGRFAYLINEMSATVAVFGWNGDTGVLAPLQTVDLLAEDFAGLRSGAAIMNHPDGRHLYATTRSHGSSGLPVAPGLDRLVWFAVDSATGLLTFAGRTESGGGIPRAIALSPDTNRLYIGHQCNGVITEFALADGTPINTGRVIATPVPVCLLFA